MKSLSYLLAAVESDLASLHHVDETSRCRHQQMAATLKIPHLGADVSSSIHHTRAHVGAVRKLGGMK